MIPGLLVYYPSGLRLGEEEGGKLFHAASDSAESLRAWFADQPVPPGEAEDVADVFERAGVADDDVRAGGFFDERHLGGLAGGELLGGPAAGDGPLQADVARGIDKQDFVAQLVPAGFEQQGGVEDDDRRRIGRVANGGQLLAAAGPRCGDA